MWELEGPIPTLNRSNVLIDIAGPSDALTSAECSAKKTLTSRCIHRPKGLFLPNRCLLISYSILCPITPCSRRSVTLFALIGSRAQLAIRRASATHPPLPASRGAITIVFCAAVFPLFGAKAPHKIATAACFTRSLPYHARSYKNVHDSLLSEPTSFIHGLTL